MADTTSPLLGLLLMATGGDDNAWGTNCNMQVFTPLENAIAGITSLSVTGGSHSLTASEARSAHIVLTGALTADQTIVVPGTGKKWAFINRTTGNFYVIVKAGSGAGVNAPQGLTTDIICTDANTVVRKDAEKVGELFYHGGNSAPAGSLACNGATPLRASAIDLFGAIGTIWGAGNSTTTFTLPNGQDTGRFLRSWSGSFAVGAYLSNQNASHTHTASSSAVTGTTDNSGNHTHANTLNDLGHTHSWGPAGSQASVGGTGAAGTTAQYGTISNNTGPNNTTGMSISNAAAGAHTHAVTGAAAAQTIASQGGNEARPESMVGLLCIRY